MASPVTLQIATSRADACQNETGGNTSVTTYPLYLGKSGTLTWVGLHWTAGVPELAGTTITAARLSFKCRVSNSVAGGTVKFFVEDSAAPLLYTAGTANYNISGRTMYAGTAPVTMNFVTGSYPGTNEIGSWNATTWYNLEPTGFKELIQHCADRADLATIAVIIHCTTSTSAYRSFWAYDNATAANCAKLIVEYTAGGNPTTIPNIPVPSAIGTALVPTTEKSTVTLSPPVPTAIASALVPTTEKSTITLSSLPVPTAIATALVPTATPGPYIIRPSPPTAIATAIVPVATSTTVDLTQTIPGIPVPTAKAVTVVPTTLKGAVTLTVPVPTAKAVALSPTTQKSTVTLSPPVPTAIALAAPVSAQPGAVTKTVPAVTAIGAVRSPTCYGTSGLPSYQPHTTAVNWIDKTVYPAGTKFYLQVRVKTFAGGQEATHPVTCRLINETAGDTIVGGSAADVTSTSTTMVTVRGTVDLGPYLGNPTDVYYVVYGGAVGGTYSCELSEIYYTSG